MSNNKQQTAVKQFVATFKTSIQIGPDDWKVINPSMLCNQNTTLGEIEHFVNSNNNIGILEFKVIELTYGGGEQMTNNKQQTAVDILCGKLAMKLGIPQAITFYIDHAEEIAEAKAMHKEEIEEAFANGVDDEYEYHINNEPGKNTEQYYNETYGGNK